MAVILIVSLLVAGWRLIIIARQPAHLLEIAKEIGSIPQTDPYTRLIASPDGSRLLYAQCTETGVGVYLCDPTTGKNELLFEQQEKGYGDSRNWGWSPENAFLAFTVIRQPTPGDPPMTISLYDGLSGQSLTNIPAPFFSWVSQFVWLSKRSFAYSPSGPRPWLVYKLNSEDNWQEVKGTKQFTRGTLANLSAISSHAIAWREKGEIWTFDFDTGVQEKLWESTTNTLVNFEFAMGSGNFMLQCSDEAGPLSLEFRPPRLSEKQGAIIEIERNPPRDAYADLDKSQGVFSFKIKTHDHPNPTSFIWEGLLRHHCLAGDSLFFMGNPADDTPGLWQYNTTDQQVKCIVPGRKEKLKFAKVVAPVTSKGTDLAGKEMIYHLWEPAVIRPGKKYPLILGQSLHDWNFYPQIAANAGFYYATPNVTNWFTQIVAWPEEIAGLYEVLSKNPNIDTNQVYFLAFSAQAGYLNQVLESKPHLCKGLILFHPAGFPDLSLLYNPRILVLGGSDDPNSPANELLRQQDEAFRLGIPIHLFIQDGVRHFNRSIGSERDHAIQVMRFLSEN